MPNVVFDASSLVGALLHARSNATICLSADVASEIREVFSRAKFQKYLVSGRRELLLDIIENGALWFEPGVRVEDCRDVKDNKYLELALAAGADTIVSSDEDLLVLNPWLRIESSRRLTMSGASNHRLRSRSDRIAISHLAHAHRAIEISEIVQTTKSANRFRL